MAYEYEFINHMKGTHFNTFLISINRRLYHWHYDIEILLVIEGSVIINTATQQYLLKKDDIFLVNSNEIHSLTRTKESNTILAIQINPKFCKTYFPALQKIKFLDKLITESEFPECWKRLKECLTEFVTEYYKKENGFELKLASTLNMLVYQLLNGIKYEEVMEDRLSAEMNNLERLNRIINYIRENYMNKVSLKELAFNENLDMYYLSHLIRKQLGISFQEYLNKVRLEKAVELILHSKLKKIDVCIESGFSDYRYLCKMFIKEYGCDPSHYKLQYKDKEEGMLALNTNESQHRLIDRNEAFQKLIEYTSE